MLGALFGRRRSAIGSAGIDLSQSSASQQKIISFRIDGDLDRGISRALAQGTETRSEFIRRAVEMLLRSEAEERLRKAHNAMHWG